MSNTPPPGKAPFDPAAVPIQTAATVLVVDDRPDLHVLMLRRRAGSNFVGGMMVFPGGGIDDADADAAALARVRGLDDATASAQLGFDAGGLAYWTAVVRETLEEVGLALVQPNGRAALDLAAVIDARHAIDRGERSIGDLLVEHDLVIDAGAIVHIGRWLTPVGLPRRYDTQFFVTLAPAGQEPVVDAVEAVHAEWMRPVDVLAQWQAGQLVMLPPTVAMVQLLGRYEHADEFVAAARLAERTGDEARVVGAIGPNNGFRVLLWGDDGYADGLGEPTSGWVHRFAPRDLRA